MAWDLVLDASGQTRRDLLHQPGVAVRVAELNERAVGAPVGRRAADAGVGVDAVAERAFVEDVADVDAARDEVRASGLDVAEDEVVVLRGPGRRGGDL
jgi:hypothetical protein